MSITIDLPAEYESALRQQASKANLAPDRYAFQLLAENLQQNLPDAAHLSAAESELLERINIGLSAEEWRQYHALIARRRARQLDQQAQQELIALSDRLEKANAERIEALVKLAQLRHTSLEALMDELGIHPPTYV
jgi:hypothetical protein